MPQDSANPEQNIMGGVQNYLSSVQPEIGAAAASNTSSPFILNPQTGQTVSNPGFLNSMQQFQLKLMSDPQFAASIESEIANLTQLESIVPTTDLANYRDPNGNVPPPGTTYLQLQEGGYTVQNAAQNEEATQLKNALDSLARAYDARKQISGVTAGIGSLLGKIGGGSIANMLPGYANYQSSVNALPTNVGSTGLNLQALFSNPGLNPQAGFQSAQQQIQAQLNNLAPNSVRSTQASPISPMALQSLGMMNSNPYDATANPVISGQKLGANARSLTGL